MKERHLSTAAAATTGGLYGAAVGSVVAGPIGGVVGTFIGASMGGKLFPSDRRTPHRKFEDDTERFAKRKYPGYKFTPQHHSKSKSTLVDIFGRDKNNPKKRISHAFII